MGGKVGCSTQQQQQSVTPHSRRPKSQGSVPSVGYFHLKVNIASAQSY